MNPFLEGKPGHIAALLAGAALPFAFAPFDLFPLAFLSPALLFLLWRGASPRTALLRGFLFGAGLFGVGVSWVFVAIHVFGETGVIPSALLTGVMVGVLALYPGLLGLAAAQLQNRFKFSEPVRLLLVLPALWVLAEWWRGWFLTGFPWLSLGYSQLESPLLGYAPVLGAFGVSLAVALTAGALALIVSTYRRSDTGTPDIAASVAPAETGTRARRSGGSRESARSRSVALLLIAAVWAGGFGLSQIQWSQPTGEPIEVRLVQGNLPQITKWDPEQIQARLDTYARLTLDSLEGADLVVWPENSVTLFYDDLSEYFDWLGEEAQAAGVDLVVGVPVRDETGRYWTSLTRVAPEPEDYRKRHLVPFGEFVPLESLLRGLIGFFDLPMSGFTPGPAVQPPLMLAGQPAGLSICYEDAFGNEVIDALPEATYLLNGSNNAWYGNSFAPHQHLQIARMRSVETARPLVRATTTGISALIDPNGRITHRSPQFRTHVLAGTVQPMQGATPYVRWGDAAILLLIAGLTLFFTLLSHPTRRK